MLSGLLQNIMYLQINDYGDLLNIIYDIVVCTHALLDAATTDTNGNIKHPLLK